MILQNRIKPTAHEAGVYSMNFPAAYVRKLGLKGGEVFDYTINENGSLTFTPKNKA